MQLIFLGTSAGVPTKQRNVTAAAIKMSASKRWSLVDCGEGTQHQLLRTPLSLAKLQTIFITHVHGDHCYGLPGLLASAVVAGRKEPLTIVGPPEIETFIRVTQQTTQMGDLYPLNFVNVADLNERDTFGDFDVQAVALSHRVESYGYCFTERNLKPSLDVDRLMREQIHSGPLWGQLQQGKTVTLDDGRTLIGSDYLLPLKSPRRVIIGGDNDKPELLADLAATANVLVHEATYTEAVSQKVGPWPQHSSAQQVAELASNAAVPNLVLTHFSGRYHGSSSNGQTVAEIADEARQYYEGNLLLANDFDMMELSSSGHLSVVSRFTQ